MVLLAVAVGKAIKNKSVKTEDANIPGQIREVVAKATNNEEGLKLAAAITKETTASMLVDSLKDKVFEMATGHKHFSYNPNDNLIVAYKNNEMFLISYVVDFKEKKVIADLNKVSHFAAEDIKKIKTNSSAGSIKIKFKDGDSIFIGAVNEYYKEVSAKEDRQAFAQFINELAEQVNE